MDTAVPSRTTTSAPPLVEVLRAIVTPEQLRAAVPDDAVAGAQPQLIIEPATEQQLAKTLALANEAGLAVIPRGGGTKLAWGNAPKRTNLILSTIRLNRIIEHVWADMTVTVEAGCTIQMLQQALAQYGQRLALDPAWPDHATIGGVLSTNDSGALRVRFGSLRDLIIGVTLALPDGTLASSGGKVVKNVAGYDLPKLATGAFGTLGVITRAIFRLHPLPQNSRPLTIPVRDANEIQRLMLAMQDSKLAHVALQARISAEASPEIDILFEGTEAGLAAQQTSVTKLTAPATPKEAAPDVWMARQQLWSLSHSHASESPGSASAIAKISVLPTSIAAVIQCIARTAGAQQLLWRAVIHATGIGWLRLDGRPEAVHAALKSLRNELEHDGGSLTVQQQTGLSAPFDAWGDSGDALALMRALKQQFDPKGTLNPGRFAGGI
jgi:glycolate oxidase FAD binding subunit